MSFELIDNFFQVAVLTLASVVVTALAIRFHERRFLILAFAYICFALGTGYWVLYLLIIGNGPQVFYVAEVSWLASYLFYLSLQILRTEEKDGSLSFSYPAFFTTVLVMGAIYVSKIFGPSLFMISLFAVTVGALTYLSVFRVRKGKESRRLDVRMLICVVLQILLYDVSEFIRDYTRFNLYFAVDIALTLSFVSLLPLLYQEVKEDDLH